MTRPVSFARPFPDVAPLGTSGVAGQGAEPNDAPQAADKGAQLRGAQFKAALAHAVDASKPGEDARKPGTPRSTKRGDLRLEAHDHGRVEARVEARDHGEVDPSGDERAIQLRDDARTRARAEERAAQSLGRMDSAPRESPDSAASRSTLAERRDHDAIDRDPNVDFVDAPLGGPTEHGSAPATPPGTAATPTVAGTAGALALVVEGREVDTALRREMSRLAPELRVRLERVIERMERELGVRVEIVETVRSQDRQDALYAQGRTTPGPVVTWTRRSNHTVGRAVDVILDGSYTNGEAYASLARVAQEEGLRSLWPRDGGHLELPSVRMSEERAATAGVERVDETAEPDFPVRTLPVERRDGLHTLPVDGRDRPRTLPLRPRDGVRTQPVERREDFHSLPIPRLMRSGIDPVSQGGDATSLGLPLAAATKAGNDTVARALELPRYELLAHGDEALANLSVREDVPWSASASTLLATTGVRAPNAGPSGSAATHVQTHGIAAVAAVASVATPAPVAQIARLAQVAEVARVAGGDPPVPQAVDDRAPTIVIPAIDLTVAGDRSPSDASTSSRDSDTPQEGQERKPAAAQFPQLDVREQHPFAASALGAESIAERRTPLGSASGSGDLVAGLSHHDASERIARVLRMQDGVAERPMTSMLLRLEDAGGNEDRIRIDLRGRTVGSTFDMSDPRTADSLRAHVRELQSALQRQGLEAEPAVVRAAHTTTQQSTQRSTEPMPAHAAAQAAEREGMRLGSASAPDGGGSTAKDSRNQPRAEDGREGKDHQKSRHRRDGKDTR